ncbi:MAG: glutamate--tRNA ligase family protein [Eubacteriales bacterium]|nr:glutamate--tRNA ligase family protein [Eubacteriales bacterium]
MDFNKLADLLYPNINDDINYYFAKYPSRPLLKDGVVTRFAPSPTGYLHIGGLFQCVLHEMLAKTPSSVFYLRLEDTDQKREIENAGDLLYKALGKFDITPMEGYRGNEPEKGIYGPYVQSKRLDIYRAFAKYLVSRGGAYPCFCSKLEDKEDIVAKREQEIEQNNDTIDHDVCRNLTLDDIEENLNAGKPFALRLLSTGNPDKTFEINDLIKGKREIRENGKDVVLIKSNGIPVYSFAHAVDDTLMGTTMIVRGEDWYQSVASHIEIFQKFGFNLIPYVHTPNICKLDDGKKRKLSKRKDPEANCMYFVQDGYPIIAVKEYLLNLLNSDFEMWRKENPNTDYHEFPFKLEKIGSGNPMFDMVKLNDVSKEYISRLSASNVYNQLLAWAEDYDTEFAEMLKSNEQYAIDVLSIERDTPKPRKDIFKWSMVREYYNYMFDNFENIEHDFSQITGIDNALLCKILQTYIVLFESDLDKTDWFERVKKLAENNNFCVDNKLYKQDPSKYNGNVASLCNIIRYAFTGKTNTPDLFSICCVLGKDELYRRLDILKAELNV